MFIRVLNTLNYTVFVQTHSLMLMFGNCFYDPYISMASDFKVFHTTRFVKQCNR